VVIEILATLHQYNWKSVATGLTYANCVNLQCVGFKSVFSLALNVDRLIVRGNIKFKFSCPKLVSKTDNFAILWSCLTKYTIFFLINPLRNERLLTTSNKSSAPGVFEFLLTILFLFRITANLKFFYLVRKQSLTS